MRFKCKNADNHSNFRCNDNCLATTRLPNDTNNVVYACDKKDLLINGPSNVFVFLHFGSKHFCFFFGQLLESINFAFLPSI